MPEGIAVVDDLHGSAAEHIGWPNQDGIAQTLGDLESLFIGSSDAILRLFDAKSVSAVPQTFLDLQPNRCCRAKFR